jgi:DNA modification methylase
MSVQILIGDVREQLRTLASDSIHCVVTSPPYWGLRDYGVEGQIGLEASPAEFIATMVDVFEGVRRVLRPDGTCWINMGDSYAGSWGSQGRDYGGVGVSVLSARQVMASQRKASGTGSVKQSGLKPKDMVMMPHRLAIALQDAGWWVRQDIVWHKPNPMPESTRDRCTKAHEYIFLLTKSEHYYYDRDAIAEPCVTPAGTPSNGVGFGHGYDDDARDRGRIKKPDGWATHEGGHGSFHRDGREKGETISRRDSFKRENSKRAAVIPGQTVGTHRPDRKESVPNGFRNKRSVWTMATKSFTEAHFATFPPELPETCIKAGCPIGGTVLDPFFGAGTTGLVADRLQRDCIGIELNPAYAEIARKRIQGESSLFADVRVAA